MADYDVSGLDDYIEQNKQELLHDSILGSSLFNYPIDIITGVKYKENFNFAAVTAPFQSGATCAFNASGTMVFTKTELLVKDVKVQDEYCPKELEAKYTQKYLRPGAHQEELPLGQFITDKMNKLIAIQMEQAIFQGDTAQSAVNLKQFDGLLKKIDAGSPVSATPSTYNQANSRTIIEEMYTLVPEAINGEDIVILMSKSYFKLLLLKLANDNLFHVEVDQSKDVWEMTYPFFNMKIIGLSGLDTVANGMGAYEGRIIATYWDNLAFVTDLQNDSENVEMFYSRDDRKIKLSYEWKAGTGVKFTNHVVEYTNS